MESLWLKKLKKWFPMLYNHLNLDYKLAPKIHLGKVIADANIETDSLQ
jgi:hypothetical protein